LTTLQEVNDVAILASHGVASILNGLILLQIIMYRKPADKKKKRE
jgi:hypothetical protein